MVSREPTLSTAKTTGERIRAAYLQKGLSRQKFAQALGTSYTTALRWEQGGTVKHTDLEAIASVTGVPVAVLTGESHVERDAPPSFTAWKRAAGELGLELTPEIEARMLASGFRFGAGDAHLWHDVHRLVVADLRGKTVRERGGERETVAARAEAERHGLKKPARREKR